MHCLRKIQLECNLIEWELPAGDQRCGQSTPRSKAPGIPRTDALCVLGVGAATPLHSLPLFSPAGREGLLQPFVVL